DISSNVLVFQKNPSWPELRLGGAVMRLIFPGITPDIRPSRGLPTGGASGSGRTMPAVQNRCNTIGLSPPLG
ncbi:MAG: hypothetical protein R3D44_00010, partial [Hyphomicrobiaceae bacterium]